MGRLQVGNQWRKEPCGKISSIIEAQRVNKRENSWWAQRSTEPKDSVRFRGEGVQFIMYFPVGENVNGIKWGRAQYSSQ